MTHFVADGVGGFAADVGIDFIENEDGHFILGGEHGLEGQHHARHFAGGRDGAQRARGFAGVGCELKFNGVEAGQRGDEFSAGEFLGRDGRERDIEMALLKAEVGELARGGFGEFRNRLAAARREFEAGFPEVGLHLCERGLQAREFGFALFERVELAQGLLAEGDHIGERAAVFAFERVQQIQALLHFLKSRGIDLDAVGVAGEVGLEIAQRGGGAFLKLRERRGGGIDAVNFLKQTAHRAELREEGIVVLAEQIDRTLGELEQAGAVAGAVKFLCERGFLIGVKFRGGDLGGLVAEEFELLRVGAFVDDERGFFGRERGAAADELREVFARRDEAGEGVEDRELARGVEERLVIVRAVHVHEPLADGGEERERGRGAVDELAVGAGGGEGALEDELRALAGFDAVFLEERGECGANGRKIEDGFDGATVRAAADEGAVGAFAEDEIEAADDDGFARAGLAGDGVVTGLKLEREVGDQREVFDSERRQHGRKIVWTVARLLACGKTKFRARSFVGARRLRRFAVRKFTG